MVVNQIAENYFAARPEAANMVSNLIDVDMIEPIDVSNAALFLVSDDGRYLTGVTMPVDAGNNELSLARFQRRAICDGPRPRVSTACIHQRRSHQASPRQKSHDALLSALDPLSFRGRPCRTLSRIRSTHKAPA